MLLSSWRVLLQTLELCILAHVFGLFLFNTSDNLICEGLVNFSSSFWLIPIVGVGFIPVFATAPTAGLPSKQLPLNGLLGSNGLEELGVEIPPVISGVFIFGVEVMGIGVEGRVVSGSHKRFIWY